MAKRVILSPIKLGSRTPEEFRAAAEAAIRRREQRELCRERGVVDPDIDTLATPPPSGGSKISPRDSDEDS